MINALIAILTGFVVGISVGSFINGFWSLIVHKCMGFQLGYFRYMFFDISRQNGRMFFSFCRVTPVCQYIYINPEQAMKTEEKKRQEDLLCTVCSLLGAWILAVVTLVFVCIAFSEKGLLFLFFTGVLLAFGYRAVSETWIAVRVLMGFDNTLYSLLQKIARDSMAGIPYEQMEIQPLENITLKKDRHSEQLYQHFRFRYSMSIGDFGAMRELVVWMEQHLMEDFLKAETPLYYDILYYYSYIGKDKEKAAAFYNRIKGELLHDVDSNGRRILAYYQYYVEGQKEKALETAREGLRVLNLFEGGQGERNLEEKCLNKLIDEICDLEAE